MVSEEREELLLGLTLTKYLGGKCCLSRGVYGKRDYDGLLGTEGPYTRVSVYDEMEGGRDS